MTNFLTRQTDRHFEKEKKYSYMTMFLNNNLFKHLSVVHQNEKNRKKKTQRI